MISPTFAQVAQQLETAPTLDALEEAAQMIQHVGGVNEQARLGFVFKARAKELKG